MTIVLASKFNWGVAFAYDLLFVDQNNKFLCLEDKVYSLGGLAVGVSGTFTANEKDRIQVLSKTISDSLQGISPRVLMEKLTMARSSRRIELGIKHQRQYPEQYLFAFMEWDKPWLYQQCDLEGLVQPQEIERCAAIGAGAYPEVKLHLQLQYRAGMAVEESIDFLGQGLQLAFEKNTASKDNFELAGQGFTTVTVNGIERYSRKS